MPARSDAALVPYEVPNPFDFDPIDDAVAGVADATESCPWRHQHFLRFAAELKALGRPFPRALELGSGPGELSNTVLGEVPGLRLVSLDFSDTVHETSHARLDNKDGRMTCVTRNAFDTRWADGLGRFDAVIAGPAIRWLRGRHRATALYSRVRPLLLPGGIFLLCNRVADDDGVHDAASSTFQDDPHEALDDAGWSSTQTLRRDHGLLLLKARP